MTMSLRYKKLSHDNKGMEGDPKLTEELILI
jgi:hypothetical protein